VAIYADAAPPDEPIHPQVRSYRLLERTRYLPGLSHSRFGRLRQAAAAALAKPAWAARLLADPNRELKEAVRSAARWHGFVWPPRAGFDLVHCQFGCVARTHWRAKTLWKAKLIVSFRGHDFSSLPRLFGPGMYRELFQEVDAVMVVCRYAVDKLLHLGCPPEKLAVHYSGTDVADFAFHPRSPDHDGRVRLLTVARLEESKGLEFALRAVAELVHRRGLDLRYTIVGSGSLRRSLELLVATLALEDRVCFTGAKSRPEVRDLMHRHHLFVLPSVTSSDGGQEGIPGSVREAMATGMPVVSTRHSGIPELVEDGVSGFLVPERDFAALADRLQDLAKSPGRWVEMGRNGREQVARRFETRRLNRRLYAFYRHVLEGGIPAAFRFEEDSPIGELAVV
jgi:colanic acid/amylovoran biosynthesis glycosyltransferase